MSWLSFKFTPRAALTVVEDAIRYAVGVTNQLLYETDLNSPFRLLVEAQTYIYNQYLIVLEQVEDALILKFLSLFSFAPATARVARVNLRFEIITGTPPTDNTYIQKGFPVRATNGLIFTTDTMLLIPVNTSIGFVYATCTRPGLYGNVARDTVTLPLQTINVPLKVTNPEEGLEGLDGEEVIDAQFRLSQFIRLNGLITLQNYIDFIREVVPRAIVSAESLEPNTVSIWVANFNGASLNQNQFQSLQGMLDRYKMIGMGAVELNEITTLNVYIEVVCALDYVTRAQQAATGVAFSLCSYVKPDNLKQGAFNTAGILILNDLERVAAQGSTIDYVQGMKIGLTPDTAYGQNFTFNPNSERVRCDRIRVVLIKANYQRTFDFIPSDVGVNE